MEGTLLGGRVRYAQPRDGYRTGIEPVMLAASVPACAGQVVIEAGTGAGAALMCLAARVPGVVGTGVELDPAMAALARRNLAANGLAGLAIETGDVTTLALPAADHAMANPPWHAPDATPSSSTRRRLAKQERTGVEAWVAALGAALRDGGTLTLVLPPRLVARAMPAFERAGLGDVVRHELPPKPGRAAKIVLLQGRRGAAWSMRAVQTVLHEDDGRYRAAIEAVLREGAALAV